jgi:hypothetical protein
MADVVDEKAIAIAPPVHVEVICGSQVVVPVGLMKNQVASIRVRCQPDGVFKDEKFERLPECWSPMKSLAGILYLEYGVR